MMHSTSVVLKDSLSRVWPCSRISTLLAKLQDVGTSTTALQWFQSYLSSRHQVVHINSTLSDRMQVRNGIPQGSILGPLLFSIYVNDLPSIPQYCSPQCYVDDTKLLLSFALHEERGARDKINQDLLKIQNWCLNNQLLLNPDKTKLLIFGSRQNTAKVNDDFNLSFFGKNLVPATTAKDFGVIMDPNLTFDNHVLETVSSCMSCLAQINRVKYSFDKQSIIIIINSLVFSKLFYCSCVWSPEFCLPHSKWKKEIRSHISGFKETVLAVPVKEHLYYGDAIMSFKCLTGCAPGYLSTQFIRRGDVTNRRTRSSQMLNIPRFRTVSGQRSFCYRAVTLWNSLSNDLKLCESVNVFKHHLRSRLLSNVSTSAI